MFINRLRKDIYDEKVIWDLIDNGKATLYELENHYSFEDLNCYLAVINCNSDYKEFVTRKEQRKKQVKGKL